MYTNMCTYMCKQHLLLTTAKMYDKNNLLNAVRDLRFFLRKDNKQNYYNTQDMVSEFKMINIMIMMMLMMIM